MKNNWRYFCNKECEYFPCHTTNNEDNDFDLRLGFNCKYCFCPLYKDDDCGGNYTILPNGIKDCSNCLIPHYNWEHVERRLGFKI